MINDIFSDVITGCGCVHRLVDCGCPDDIISAHLVGSLSIWLCSKQHCNTLYIHLSSFPRYSKLIRWGGGEGEKGVREEQRGEEGELADSSAGFNPTS